MGLLGLYALYRRLCPPNVPPDGKLYRRLWSVQKDLPIVILHSRTVWFAPEFLTKYAPYSKDPRKLDPQDVDGRSEPWAGRLVQLSVGSWVDGVDGRGTAAGKKATHHHHVLPYWRIRLSELALCSPVRLSWAVSGFRRQFTSRLDDEFPGRIQSLCQQVRRPDHWDALELSHQRALTILPTHTQHACCSSLLLFYRCTRG